NTHSGARYGYNRHGLKLASLSDTMVFGDNKLDKGTYLYEGSGDNENIGMRHTDGFNAVMLDGHAEHFSNPYFELKPPAYYLPTSSYYESEWGRFWARQ